ncbi:MAG TPA: M23 family metallopeptidase [Gemmatimonadales bacterium]|nr:M23 family metallopeptidase [Gemmatimonadales bacterium]
MTHGKQRGVTIVVQIDGDLNTRQYRLPFWVFTVGKWGAVLVVVLAALFFAFAGPITRSAARVPGLEREIARLQTENSRVQELATALNHAEASYQDLRRMLGIKAGDNAKPGSPAAAAAAAASEDLMQAPDVVARVPGSSPAYEPGPSAPSHWPVDVPGYVTRGQVRPGDQSETHPGIDIAVAVGTQIRASGGGTVVMVGTDSAYGLFVLLRHPDGYESMYGHASRLLVRENDEVSAGQVIALSGSTGRSTAPHLHFEIRRGGRSLDPLTLVKEGN